MTPPRGGSRERVGVAPDSPGGEVGGLVDHLFRHEASRIVAALTRSLGPRHLGLAEEALQEAMVEALKRWPFHGVPERPGAWLHRVARNRALDHLRRRSAFRDKEPEIRRTLLPAGAATGSDRTALSRPGRSPDTADTARFRGELTDDQLRLVFLCCHPELPRDARVALTLKLVCGFGVAEIARAFLDKRPTVAQRLVRAKRTVRDRSLPFEVPAPTELPGRFDSVLEVVYLLFNEGHASTGGDELVRADVCAEALRLAEELARLAGTLPAPAPARLRPTAHALAALLCFQASRLPARLDNAGAIVLLADHDRSRWDRSLVRRGFAHLEGAAAGPRLTAYHLEAAIASHHAAAPTWDATDWPAILGLYDQLLALRPSPVVALNRAVAVAEAVGRERGAAEGARAGLQALDELEADPDLADALASYHLLPATRGTLLLAAGAPEQAARSLRRALELCAHPAERELLEKRLARAEERA